MLDQLIAGRPTTQKERLLKGFRDVVGTIILLAEPLSAPALSQLLNISLSIYRASSETSSFCTCLFPLAVRCSYPNLSPILSRLSCRPIKEGDQRILDQRASNPLESLRPNASSSYQPSREIFVTSKSQECSLLEVDQQIIDKYLPSEVKYACLYWVYHLELAEVSVQDSDLVYTFLTNAFPSLA